MPANKQKLWVPASIFITDHVTDSMVTINVIMEQIERYPQSSNGKLPEIFSVFIHVAMISVLHTKQFSSGIVARSGK